MQQKRGGPRQITLSGSTSKLIQCSDLREGMVQSAKNTSRPFLQQAQSQVNLSLKKKVQNA